MSTFYLQFKVNIKVDAEEYQKDDQHLLKEVILDTLEWGSYDHFDVFSIEDALDVEIVAGQAIAFDPDQDIIEIIESDQEDIKVV